LHAAVRRKDARQLALGLLHDIAAGLRLTAALASGFRALRNGSK
jgi:hypothetical protein